MHLYSIAALTEFDVGKVTIPALIVGLFLGLLFIVWAMTKRYKRIAPNVIGVIFGKKSRITTPDGKTTEVGFRMVNGGGVFVWPVVEEFKEMSTEAFQIKIAEDNIPTKKNVSVHVAGVATCRISPILEEQVNAVQNFLGKPVESMENMIGEILRGHLRSIVGGLEVEELLRERSKFNEMVVHECSQELARMGIKILTLVIQDVKDKEGYIEALGKQAVAVAKRDAQIATAEAERETTIKTSDAQRAAAEAKAQNDAKIKDAEKTRDVQVAQFKLETATKQAEADMAGQIAKTAQEQRLAVLEAERDGATAEAQTKVQQLEATRKSAELQATTIVTAEAEAKAMSIRATGKQNAERIEAETRKNVATLEAETVKLTAEGQKNAAIFTGQGESQKLLLIAEATATGNQKTMLAQAEGEQAQLLAQAKGTEAQLLAVAVGEKAKLLAQAEGNQKLAEALQQLNEAGKLMFVLERLPGLLDHGGDAAEKIARAIFEPVAAGVAKMGNVQITDLGGGNTAKNGMAALGQLVPQIVVDFFSRAKASGVDVTGLLTFLKMDPAALANMLGSAATVATVKTTNETTTPPPAPIQEPEAPPIIVKPDEGR